jgi:hypothetical protein
VTEHDPQDGITVTKLDAARRQIDTAIHLWFAESDPVSIHTLTAAARRITLDLSTHRKKHLGLFDTSFIRKGMEKDYKKTLREAETFFKHAKDDPDAQLTFHPGFTEAYLLDSLLAFHILTGSSTFLMSAFHFRFLLFHPDAFRTDFLQMVKEPDRIKFRAIPKKSFLGEFQKFLPQLIDAGHLTPK